MFGTFLIFLFLLRKRRDDEYAVYHTLLTSGIGRPFASRDSDLQSWYDI